jgi:hypothetical protein
MKEKSHDIVECHIGQYFWLPSLFQAYKSGDHHGTSVLEWVECRWNCSLRQFARAYVCMSIAKRFWEHAVIRVAICDGTHTRALAFKHIILIATTMDPNNQITILATALVDVENNNNWVWFKEHLEDDFPGIITWMSDADKGIRSNAFSLSMSQSENEFVLSWCARHLAENCKDACGGIMNEDQKHLITELAKSLNEDVYSKRLDEIRNINTKWAEYLYWRKDQFTATSFLDKGIQRWGIVTSNVTETINGIFGEARSHPVVYLLEHLLQYQRGKYQERYNKACQWLNENRMATDYFCLKQQQLSGSASRRDVQIIKQDHPMYRARVQVSVSSPITAYVEVTVELEKRWGVCPCQYQDEMGMNCTHTNAVLLSLNKTSLWCSARYHTQTYKACYSAPIPAMSLVGKLSADVNFVPPDYKKPAGRPSKKSAVPWFSRIRGLSQTGLE